MGSFHALFLQIYPNLVSHMKLVGNKVLVMVLLVLSIGFLKNIMDLLVDVIDIFNEFGGSSLTLD
jgi:hypothetical protein